MKLGFRVCGGRRQLTVTNKSNSTGGKLSRAHRPRKFGASFAYCVPAAEQFLNTIVKSGESNRAYARGQVDLNSLTERDLHPDGNITVYELLEFRRRHLGFDTGYDGVIQAFFA